MNYLKHIGSFLIILQFSININAQCYPDRHSTNWFDAWISCESNENPNDERPVSHWIMYDLGAEHVLGEMQVWNINDPSHLDRGFNQVYIDFSSDGSTWTELGLFNFSQGSGESIYEGFEAADFEENHARYVLLTADSNYGGDCYGISEIKIDAELFVSVEELAENPCFQVQLFPNPFRSDLTAVIHAQCYEPMTISIVNTLGKEVFHQSLRSPQNTNRIPILNQDLASGMYYFVVSQGDKMSRETIVKMGDGY